jgi:hypothetical protein
VWEPPPEPAGLPPLVPLPPPEYEGPYGEESLPVPPTVPVPDLPWDDRELPLAPPLPFPDLFEIWEKLLEDLERHHWSKTRWRKELDEFIDRIIAELHGAMPRAGHSESVSARVSQRQKRTFPEKPAHQRLFRKAMRSYLGGGDPERQSVPLAGAGRLVRLRNKLRLLAKCTISWGQLLLFLFDEIAAELGGTRQEGGRVRSGLPRLLDQIYDDFRNLWWHLAFHNTGGTPSRERVRSEGEKLGGWTREENPEQRGEFPRERPGR